MPNNQNIIESALIAQPIKKLRLSLVVGVSVVIMLASFLFMLSAGRMSTDLLEVAALLFADSETSNKALVIQELRLPRALIAILVGAALSMAGTIIQSITRNPLGSPSLTGVTAGAAFAIVLAFVTYSPKTDILMLVGTFGGICAALITFSLARQSRFDPVHLTLAGVSVSIFFMAAISALMLLYGESTNAIYFWLIGSFSGRTMVELSHLWYWVFIGLALGVIFSPYLNLLLLDDDICHSIGINVTKWRFILGLIAVILTAACVAVAGPVGFIGFIVPHITRKLLGVQLASIDHKILLPLTALVGGALTIFMDALSRSQIIGIELPIGISSTFIGGILFVILFKKRSI